MANDEKVKCHDDAPERTLRDIAFHRLSDSAETILDSIKRFWGSPAAQTYDKAIGQLEFIYNHLLTGLDDSIQLLSATDHKISYRRPLLGTSAGEKPAGYAAAIAIESANAVNPQSVSKPSVERQHKSEKD